MPTIMLWPETHKELKKLQRLMPGKLSMAQLVEQCLLVGGATLREAVIETRKQHEQRRKGKL